MDRKSRRQTRKQENAERIDEAERRIAEIEQFLHSNQMNEIFDNFCIGK